MSPTGVLIRAVDLPVLSFADLAVEWEATIAASALEIMPRRKSSQIKCHSYYNCYI